MTDNPKPSGPKTTRRTKQITVEVVLNASSENTYYWRQSLQLLAIIAQRRRNLAAVAIAPQEKTQ